MQSRRSFLAVPAAFAFVDWPQWRGPARDGSVPAEAAKPWPERLRRVWNMSVGEGHSSPVVTGKRVFQFTRLQDREVIAAYDLDSGKQLWQQGYPAPYTTNPAATGHGKGPKATPAVSGNRVYTLGIEGMLACWDANTGSKVWNFDSKGSPDFGAASSPVIDGTTLIAAIGPQTGGSLTAFDAASGKIKWQWKEDGPAYASPVIVSAGNVRQVITNSQSNLIGVALSDGKLLWKQPLKTSYDQNSVTPMIVGD
ncbi:MAG TPA: PQQ-binding-like beta-propeller repeat protein, partial [Bryobacteraceae bacterium]|nr:PQQ-binding-like beta-propeller repeat protein [Bryobacteraceae bacterium]